MKSVKCAPSGCYGSAWAAVNVRPAAKAQSNHNSSHLIRYLCTLIYYHDKKLPLYIEKEGGKKKRE